MNAKEVSYLNLWPVFFIEKGIKVTKQQNEIATSRWSVISLSNQALFTFTHSFNVNSVFEVRNKRKERNEIRTNVLSQVMSSKCICIKWAVSWEIS